MAIKICHECGHQISDTVETCPYCGAKVNQSSGKSSASFLDTLLNIIFAAVGAFFTLVQIGTMHSDMNGRYTYSPPLTAHETQVLIMLIVGLILCVSCASKAIKNIYFPSTTSKNYLTIKPQTQSHTVSHLCICPVCQAKNPAGSKFCSKCGAELQNFSDDSSKSDETGD